MIPKKVNMVDSNFIWLDMRGKMRSVFYNIGQSAIL